MTSWTSRRHRGERPALSRALLLVLLLATSPASAQLLPSFQGVGDLPGGDVDSVATAVAADGSVVVGVSESTAGTEAFYWTPGGGIQGIGFLDPSDPRSEASGVSGDGSVIVGSSRNSSGDRAFRWTSGGGFVTLGTLSCSSCDPTTAANAISANGQVVVGSGLAKSLFGDPHLDAVRWPSGGTSIDDLGDLSGPQDINTAWGVSANGAVIVGEGNSSSGIQAWVWTSGTGMDALPGVPGAMIRSGAPAVSGDGSTVVGFANTSTTSTNRLEAVRWTGASYGTVDLLGALPGAATDSSAATAVTDDGSLIVGRARNSGNSDRAFLWDAVNGMRELSEVLETDYGLDLTGWTLSEALGISDIGPDGEFTIVGMGTDPNGDPQGWVAFLPPPACNDGEDNDLDTDTDFPADAECTGIADLSEVEDCSDGIDNDGDGDTDFPTDLDCTSATDQTEEPDCSDGIDNDGDTLVDYPDDPGCAGPDSLIEDPACDDGMDNDTDGDIDHPADAQCVSRADLSELDDCSDGLDNDGDGDTDFPADADCQSATDASEAPECSDGVDNDGDTLIDYPGEYPDCTAANDPIEAPQCSDGVDNDGNGDIDLADPDCPNAGFHTESPGSLADDDLVVVDRTSGAVFEVDPSTGAQTLLSQLALMTAPEGIAQRGGALVAADAAGLIEIDPTDGRQRLASDPLSSGGSLQVVFDASDDAYVLESSGISHVAWNPSGLGVTTTFLAVPTGEAVPLLGELVGDTLALESSGDLLTTGQSLFGDGVYRIDVGTQTPSVLKTGFTLDQWLDLAIEADGTILGVGSFAASGAGVYRIDPVSGVATALATGSPFVTPTGVTRTSAGDIYVADAGAGLVHVDPVSGTPTVVSSGGFMQGEMDVITALPEPGEIGMLLAGLAFLAVAGRRRMRP